jgi:hypothetical protein
LIAIGFDRFGIVTLICISPPAGSTISPKVESFISFCSSILAFEGWEIFVRLANSVCDSPENPRSVLTVFEASIASDS